MLRCAFPLTDCKNQEQRPGRPNPITGNQNTNKQCNVRRVIPWKSTSLDFKTLKEKDPFEVVHKLIEGMVRFKFLLWSQEEQHNSDEFIFDLTCTLAVACRATSSESTNKVLAALKGSVFLSLKIPRLLDGIQVSTALNDLNSRRRFIECLIMVFMKYLTHLPSSYVDLPYAQLKLALDQSSIERKEELEKELDTFKQAREDIIRSERQKHGKRYINRVREKPPNDFRDLPICPTNKEITTQERPFLRNNITEGRYDNAEHYLDVQFRLLREDFIEPLREGIHEIVQNIPRHQRKQLMRNYRSVKIVDRKFTIHQLQIDVSGMDTRRLAHSNRLIYGSFICLSKDNFKTMLFATVADRKPEDLKRGRIDIRFIEGQAVLGIESRHCVYQMVESPAYFEAYRHVLKGLKELDETTLPFKKYLVECSGDVNPPEYLRRDDRQEPVCYDLRKVLEVRDSSSASAVPVLTHGAWPSAKTLPMNNSQFEALRTAITTEFSVIQGPPGTGKTYVGAKIVRCLLENRRAWDPEHNSLMLMVCYTNHALDQFLEKVLEFLPSRQIIRVGGRSKSENLEACNLKKFTHRFRLFDKRHYVLEKMTQNDKEIKECKEHLIKAEKQLLLFDDLEELLHSAHADQLYNAKFPSNVANECRNPANTFELWLCDNKGLNAINQSKKTRQIDQIKRHRDETNLEEIKANEEDQMFYDAELFTSPHVVDEKKDNKPETLETGDASPAENSVNLTEPLNAVDAVQMMTTNRPELKKHFSEQHELKINSHGNPLPNRLMDEQGTLKGNQLSSSASSDSLHVETTEDFTISKLPQVMEETNTIGKNEDRKTEKGQICERVEDVSTSTVDEETIAIELDADLIQYQRIIQGDEELLMAISEQTNGFVNQDQEQARKNQKTDDGCEKVSYRNKGKAKPYFWQYTEDESSREESTASQQVFNVENDDGMAKKNSGKVVIRGDISSLKDDLDKETMMSSDEAMGVNNIWSLTKSNRLRLYLFWIENYRERYRVEIHRCEQKYAQLCDELEAVRFKEEEQVIRRATVVGMTTSGAARYHSMLQRVAPRIVVIEEAAEVMEAHIITSLSHNTKHTILIGDHKQLRPKATVYELAQEYNLEVSLFERMVMNSMDCKRLSIQHRMRPEIAALTKRIYDHEIIDHESVCHFEDISGFSHNLFFIEHHQPEQFVGGLQSYANQHEAEFLVALCNHLLLQGYEKSQITILTMYTGQLLFLQEEMPRQTLGGVKVCAVDSFQGEENDIILLSLVRSNSEGRIGFLGESNRICVALSRARKGLYCVGNFNLLKSQSKLWKEICDDLKAKDAIADNLQLVCKNHNNVTSVRKANEFNRLGGCNMPCEIRLPCGHACDKQCHASSHLKDECVKMCLNRCPSEHPCLCRCHYPNHCPRCQRKMSKTVPNCGHEQIIPCSVDPEGFSCRMKCEKVLTCGHSCPNKCGETCTSQCKVHCIKSLPCGHQKHLPCYKDPMVYKQCNENCTKLLECGHPCPKKCKEMCQCDTVIDIQLPCEHMKRVLCREKDLLIQCKERCTRKLDCGHDCPGICHEDCRMRQCKIDVVKSLPCGHQQNVTCHQDPRTVFCFAPCPRKLDCGHKCFSVCGRLCQDVQCEEPCQKKCERGHSCEKSCHFGSSCGNCMIAVRMTIAACGHTVTKPCYVSSATLKCKQPCERARVCGHPCQEICSMNCEARPCEVLVIRTLPCNHVVSLECHKDPENFVCKDVVEVQLLCGHNASLECHVGLENVSCQTQIEKELPCSHKLIVPCHKFHEDSICSKKVNVKLPCGHTKSLPCSIVTAGLLHIPCTVEEQRTLPCKHQATIPCNVNPKEHCCEKDVEIRLSCEHKKLTKCFNVRNELEAGICYTKVPKKLPCGHEKEMPCSDKPDKAFCNAQCERVLPCGHPCPNKCGDDCTSFKCAVGVKKELSCRYHSFNCLCSEDVSQLVCLNKCKRKLGCGHKCPGKCSDDCSQYECQKMVLKKLHCAHSLRMPCSGDASSVTCKKRCNRNLDCSHPCPGICSEPCESMKCLHVAQKRYPCGHKEQLPCFQSKTATCRAPCRRRERCKHMCRGFCGKPCSNYPCDVLLGKTLPCGHKVKMPCSYSVNDVQCPAPCGAELPCGHQCSGICNDCQQRGSHEMCRHPCSRILVCLHRCKATCSEPCPPCDRECGRCCPHEKCTKRCSQPCKPCKQPCTWSCPHYQCNNPCGEECDRPRCDAPCTKQLACRHPCIGLCGENCPTLCTICHARKLSSILGQRRGKTTEGTRYLQLFDCGHILAVEEMDAWMMQELGNEVQLICCPRCSKAITFSFRYGNLIKRTLKNNEDVQKQMHDLADEAARIACRLKGEQIYLSYKVREMKFPRDILGALQRFSWSSHTKISDRIHVRSIPFVFTIRNHLLILHQINKAQRSLRRIREQQTSSSREHLEIQQHSNTIKQALENILEYLMKPQLDLRILHQLHEHTRKFSLFSWVLEAQCVAIKRQMSLSSMGETRLKMARNEFHLFLQGNNDALRVDWLEKIVASLRKEVDLAVLQPEEPKDFENFPGYSRGVWKLCEHRQVYYTRSIVRDGKDVTVVSNNCRQCVDNN